MQKILIVEDEEELSRGIADRLCREGFTALRVSRGDAVVNAVLKDEPDLVLLDVMLPGLNGLDVCRELRRRGLETPIIMLTAKAEEIDRVLGLEIGADDYVTKPFSIRELVARIRARLRRPEKTAALTQYRLGDVEIDFERCRASRRGQPVDMTPRELEMLRLLIRRRGQVVTRDDMLNEVWGYDALPTTRTVDTHMVKLRQKIEADPSRPRHILSVYGEGDKFVG